MKKIAVLSDVHANVWALRAVVQHALKQGCEAFWFLGDLVGRGPAPMETWEKLRGLHPEVWLAGNWDWGMVGRLDQSTFDRKWWESLSWQRRILAQSGSFEPLKADLARDATIAIPWSRVHLAHGFFDPRSPRRSVTKYLMPGALLSEVARMWTGWEQFVEEVQQGGRARPPHVWMKDGVEARRPWLLLLGHTHVPTVWSMDRNGQWRLERVQSGRWFAVDSERRWVVNVGSVGNPRRQACATYVLLQEEESEVWKFTFFYVNYPLDRLRNQVRVFYPPRLSRLVLPHYAQECSLSGDER